MTAENSGFGGWPCPKCNWSAFAPCGKAEGASRNSTMCHDIIHLSRNMSLDGFLQTGGFLPCCIMILGTFGYCVLKRDVPKLPPGTECFLVHLGCNSPANSTFPFWVARAGEAMPTMHPPASRVLPHSPDTPETRCAHPSGALGHMSRSSRRVKFVYLLPLGQDRPRAKT